MSATSVPNTRITRLADRARYDRETAYAILDAGLVAHLAVVVDGAPVVLPFACARAGDQLVLHGSTRAGVLSAIAGGAPVSVAVTLIDGLVVARSAFHSSMNYRSVVVHGSARVVDDAAEKVRLLEALADHLTPGRRAVIRPMNDGELRATQVLTIALETFSAKIRTGGPIDAPEDLDPNLWAGVFPLAAVFGTPQPDATTRPQLAPPELRAAGD